MSISISSIWTSSFPLTTSRSAFSLVYLTWASFIFGRIWHRLFCCRCSKSTICCRWVSCSTKSITLRCTSQFSLWSIFISNIIAAHYRIILRLTVHFSLNRSSSSLILFSITWKPVRNRFTWLWSPFFCSRTSLLAWSSLTMVNYSSILVTWTINNICLRILTSIIYIMNIFL